MSLQHVSGPLPAPQDHGATKAREVGWSCRKTCNVSCVLQDAILTHLLGWMCLVGACPVGSWGHQTQHPAAVLCAVASHPGAHQHEQTQSTPGPSRMPPTPRGLQGKTTWLHWPHAFYLCGKTTSDGGWASLHGCLNLCAICPHWLH